MVTAIALAVVSTTLINLAYLREHDAAAALPCLSMRRPLHSARLLIGDHSWMLGFAMEASGFVFYAGALALGSLALTQSIGAGGIGVLAFISAHAARRRLGARRRAGVGLSVAGLLALGLSLSRDGGAGGHGSTAAVVAWVVVTAVAGAAVLSISRRPGALGVAGGLFFSIGDLSTKLATQGGARIAFVITLIIGYTLGTALLQLGYQRGGALTVAGPATLLTNALPIAAGTIALGEPVPSGVAGALRILAFVAVILGAILLSTASAAKPASGAAAAAAVGPRA